ncbi:RNA-guided endonuclease IscB [Phocaeicola dorei]
MVYVINKQGQALMPTERFGKVRRLLKNGLAHVVCRIPFTIQLDYDTTDYTQPISLGVDAGSKHIGISATTSEKELYAADVELRNDIVDKLSTRREQRRTRRSRLRYRKARFNNRISSKRKGWLAPSVENKIQTHLTVVEKIHKFLPITNIVVETASFDIQKIKNPSISNEEYQQGEQLDFFNVREYILFRDGHTCQHCKGKSKDKVLNVHHIESRKTGGDSPNNLITLCETCHKAYHRGEFELNVKRGKSFRDAAFMGIMRWNLYDRLKNIYPNVSMTFGYITKNTRITNNLPKEHYVDARCISGNPVAKPLGYYFYQKKVRCQNRQIHKVNFLKGGRKKLNQAPFLVKGFRLFDLVEYQKDLYYIFGRRDSGFFDIRKLDGTKVNKGSISCKQMRLIDIRKTIIIEKRIASKFMKKGDKVREIGDTLTGTIVYIANGYADVKYPNMKGVCSLPVQFLEKV